MDPLANCAGAISLESVGCQFAQVEQARGALSEGVGSTAKGAPLTSPIRGCGGPFDSIANGAVRTLVGATLLREPHRSAFSSMNSPDRHRLRGFKIALYASVAAAMALQWDKLLEESTRVSRTRSRERWVLGSLPCLSGSARSSDASLDPTGADRAIYRRRLPTAGEDGRE